MSKDTRKINMIDANKPVNEIKDESVNNPRGETKNEHVSK